MPQISKQINDIDAFKALLRQKGLKATPQRLAVHEAMMELGHASADMICDVISDRGAVKVTVASVYNILTQLASLGIYKLRLSSSSKMFFDVNSTKHLHLFDTRNQEFKDVFDDELIEIVEEHFRKRHFRGYKIDGIEVQLVCHPTRKQVHK